MSSTNNVYVDLQSDDERSLLSEHESSASFFDVFKEISGIAIPMGLSFAYSFEVFLTVFLLQRLSETDEEIAAAGLVSTMVSTVCGLALSPFVIVSNNLSGKLGKWYKEKKKEDEGEEIGPVNSIEIYDISQEKEEIEAVSINSFLLASVLMVPATVILYNSSSILTSVFRQDSVVAHSAQKFLRPFSFAVPGLMAKMCLEQIIFSFGNTRPAMYMALTSFSIGATLSVLLGFGIDVGSIQFPKMNQVGVALGFVLETYLTALAYGLFVKFGKNCREFDFYAVSIGKLKRNFDGLKEILRKGGTNTFSAVIELSLTLAIVIFSGILGTKQQAAMAYCMQFIYFEFIMIAAFSFSCAQELSRQLGAEQARKAKAIARYGLLTSLVYLIPIPFLFAVYPKSLEALSGGVSEDISNILRSLVPIMSVGVILDAARHNLLQQSRPLNDLLIPSIIALLGMSSGIAMAAILGFETLMGIDGIAAGYTFGVGVTATALFLRWRPKIQQLTVVEADTNTALEPEAPASGGLWNCFASFFSSPRTTVSGAEQTMCVDTGSSTLAIK